MSNTATSIVSAILGGLVATGVTLVSVGWSEAEKQAELNRAQALADFAEATWGDDRQQYDRKVSSLTVYASPEVIQAHALWVQAHCNDTVRSGSDRCKGLWADVVIAMRAEIGMRPVDKRLIVEAIWEKPER